MEKLAQDAAPAVDDKAASDADRKAQVRMLLGAALGGGTGYLLTRYGFGSKDPALGLIGTGLGAGVGTAVGHGLVTQGAAEDAATARALRQGEAVSRYGQPGGWLDWYNPFSSNKDIPKTLGAARRLQIPLTAGAAFTLSSGNFFPRQVANYARGWQNKKILKRRAKIGKGPKAAVGAGVMALGAVLSEILRRTTASAATDMVNAQSSK